MLTRIQGYIDGFCKKCNIRNDGHTVECYNCGEARYKND